MGKASLKLPCSLAHDDLVFVADYNNRGHELFLPRAKVERTGIFIYHRLIFVITPFSD
jgi:hypothetical protein